MRITLAEIENYKRVRHVKITPADRNIILIGGKNRQGKTSTLDALTVAIGGKRFQAADPVRHGAEEAAIHIEMDNGLVIDRKIQPDGTSVLDVRDKSGKVSSPQAMLDKLVGTRFLDPLAFLGLKPPEQRAQLLAIIDKDGALAKLEERREHIFSHRTEIGRQLKHAEGELARLPKAQDVKPQIDIAALAEERARFADEQNAGDVANKALNGAQRELAASIQRIEVDQRAIADLERQLADRRKQLTLEEATRARLATNIDELLHEVSDRVATWNSSADRRTQIDSELARANEHNREVIQSEQSNKRRSDASAVVKRLEIQRNSQTEHLDKIDAQKFAFLAESQLPVEGLGIEVDCVTYAGVPLAQASGAERHRVALAIAIAASPNLDDIWIRDGALLDEDSLAQVAADAEAAGKCIWVERISDHDDGAIIISDGTIID